MGSQCSIKGGCKRLLPVSRCHASSVGRSSQIRPVRAVPASSPCNAARPSRDRSAGRLFRRITLCDLRARVHIAAELCQCMHAPRSARTVHRDPDHRVSSHRDSHFDSQRVDIDCQAWTPPDESCDKVGRSGPRRISMDEQIRSSKLLYGRSRGRGRVRLPYASACHHLIAARRPRPEGRGEAPPAFLWETLPVG
jgi:hypothetical protein